MARKLSPAHKIALAAGRAVKRVEEDRAKRERGKVWKTWVHEDARLWGIYQAVEGAERTKAHAEWMKNFRLIPELP